MKDWKKFAWLAGIFLVAHFLPQASVMRHLGAGANPVGADIIRIARSDIASIELPDTLVFCALTVVMSTIVGYVFGTFA